MIPEINFKVNQKNEIVICTLADGEYKMLLDIMRPTVEYYGRKHNIDTIFLTERLCSERPTAWDKVVLINGLLKYYEIVMWMDADTIIVDPEPDIRMEIKPDTIMLLCTHEGIQPCCPNTGVWIVKRNPKSLELLNEIWNQNDMIQFHPWEQGALFKLLGCTNPWDYHTIQGPTKYTPYVETLDIKWNSMIPFNGLLGVSQTPVIEHYCAIPLEERIYQLKQAYQKFKQGSKQTK